MDNAHTPPTGGVNTAGTRPAGSTNTALVVAASSAGTAFEWYDFFVFGTLASIISARFTSGSASAGFIFTLGAFAAGFIVRPFGAMVFGYIGDRFGRKKAFIQTILLMGASTMAIGLLPGMQTIGVAAPILLVLIRVIQGFAMGGEYGGAAVYVAEHAHPAKRGLLTGWIQSTAAVGLLLALAIVLATRTLLGEAAFQAWGWRVPFLMSSVLLGLSLWIRLKLSESPAFQKMKDEARLSKAPLSEAFRGQNLRRFFIALFAILLAQGAVWYTAHFYAQFYLERVLKMDARLVNQLVMAAVLLSAGGYVFFGWLSDRWGRKPVMLLGMIISVVAYFPAFSAMTAWGNPGLLAAVKSAPVTVSAPMGECHVQFDALGRRKLQSACDVMRTALADAGVPYRDEAAASLPVARLVVGERVVSGWAADTANVPAEMDRVRRELREALGAAGYPVVADKDAARPLAILGVLVLLMLASTALYGPQAAALVELFPTQVRYTALSIPYNIGVGWVGGLLPVSAFALVAARGDINAGLWYPLLFTLVSIVCALLFLPETRGVPLDEAGLDTATISRSHSA
jgi:MFS family permease